MNDVIVSGFFASRTGSAKGRDGTIDQARVQLAHLLIRKAEPVKLAGTKILHKDVRCLEQAQENLTASIRFQVKRNRFLVARLVNRIMA